MFFVLCFQRSDTLDPKIEMLVILKCGSYTMRDGSDGLFPDKILFSVVALCSRIILFFIYHFVEVYISLTSLFA